MRPADRCILALSLVVVDALLFVVPLTGVLAAYVVLARPPWFRAWVEQLYGKEPGVGGSSEE